MVLLAAAAAAAALSGKKAFDYNRENFMEDREMRMKKEFAERKFRLSQGALWREDCRNFVGLAERKMAVYLLVGVLLLSFNVNLWTEGRLPESTPEWLTMGMQIAIAVSFLFLLLSVWLAMHAAVAAQGYQTRVLTQLVRLPMPSWEELEASRTYGSEFERIEPRQMFRVPFLNGQKQEHVAQDSVAAAARAAVPDAAAGASEGEGRFRDSSVLTNSPRGTPQQTPRGPPQVLGMGLLTPRGQQQQESLLTPRQQEQEQLDKEAACDPWGLERSGGRGGRVYELGSHYGEDVAKLRHIRLMRQAAVYWQTYDAFARVAMSVGTNQLLLAMSYYILGYALTQVHAPWAAFVGVIVFSMASYLLALVDLTLEPLASRLFQAFLSIGPAIACFAAYYGASKHEAMIHLAECLAPLAFFSHGLVLGMMTLLVNVRTQENGAKLPLAFAGVLFLDVFGWAKHHNACSRAKFAAMDLEAPDLASHTVCATPFLKEAKSTLAASPNKSFRTSQPLPEGRTWLDDDDDEEDGYAEDADALGYGGRGEDVHMGDDYDSPFGDNSRPSYESNSNRLVLQRTLTSLEWNQSQASASSQGAGEGYTRPALSCIHYEGGAPIPMRPQDARPDKASDDMSSVPGAPRMWEKVDALNPPGKTFWGPVSFMPPEVRQRNKIGGRHEEDGQKDAHAEWLRLITGKPDCEDDMETGHDQEAPGRVPWDIFRRASFITTIVWIVAGTYYLLQATHMFSVAGSAWLRAEPSEAALVQDLGQYADFMQHHHGLGLAGGLIHRWAAGRTPEQLKVSWPYPSMAPQHLACDSTGRSLLVSDGLSLYAADLNATFLDPSEAEVAELPEITLRGSAASESARSWPPPVGFAATAPCAGLLGEAIQDTGLLCEPHAPERCQALVLHRQGRIITSCPLQAVSSASLGAFDQVEADASKASPVLQTWLHKAETIATMSVDTSCTADSPSAMQAFQDGCVSLQTTLGRSVQLQVSSTGKLMPAEEEASTPASAKHGFEDMLHCSGGGYVYLLGKGPSPPLWRVRIPVASDSSNN